MRYLPAALREKLLLAVQAESTKSAPSVDLWLSRPDVTLQGSAFLERQLIGTYASVSGISIAECHPQAGKDSTHHFIAFIENGTVRVIRSAANAVMNEHIWSDSGFSATGTSVAIAFDGKMPKDTIGNVEFVTETLPWVFWTDSGGVLYGQKLGDDTPTVLAMQNATDVTAVRGMWSEVGDFDFGLVVFFLLNGQLHYRQLIDGEWTDALHVSSIDRENLTAYTFTKVAASRTWDYRIAVQLIDNTGVMHELLTQFAGIAKQNAEHIEITDIKASADLIEVTYKSTAEAEHIEIAEIDAEAALIYGLTSVPLTIVNIDDGTGNCGLYIQIVFDYPIHDVSGNHACFVLADSNGVTYRSTALSLCEDGFTLILTMPDFNLAALGLDCTMTYTPGAIKCVATDLEAFSYSFRPTGLIAPIVDPPVLEAITNE